MADLCGSGSPSSPKPILTAVTHPSDFASRSRDVHRMAGDVSMPTRARTSPLGSSTISSTLHVGADAKGQ